MNVEELIKKSKQSLSDNGYGTGTNFTVNSVVYLMAEFAREQLLLNGVSSSLPIAGYLFNGRFYKTLDDLRGKTMNEENKPIPVYFGNDC